MSLPYERGVLLPDTAADLAKLRAAWRIVAERSQAGTLFNFTGLERSLPAVDIEPSLLDDDLAPALFGERLTELGLEHLGGEAGRHDIFVANRLTAAIVAAMQVLVRPGDTVVGVSPTYSHPVVARAVRLAGGELVDTVGVAEFAGRLEGAALAVVTRLAVSYEALTGEELADVLAAADAAGVPVFVDDAGGARVGPAVFDQPRTLELGAVAGATGLDKYGVIGPRLGLLGGEAELVARVRARAVELGLEARPMLYPAVVRSLEQYTPERVRELVAATHAVGDALDARLGATVERTPVAAKLQGEAILERTGIGEIVPYEATAALAMLLLRDHGILTVHFAALPPGTSALLLKFLPPETLKQFGGADAFAAAVEAALEILAGLGVEDLRALLGVGAPAPVG